MTAPHRRHRADEDPPARFGRPQSKHVRAVRRTVCAALAGGILVAGQLGLASSVAYADEDDQATEATACSAANPQLIPDASPPLAMLQSTAANRVATGKGVTVAVIDSGVAASNEHFPAGALLPGINLVADEGDPNGFSDSMGHGTTVAGIIGARSLEGSGAVGVAPDATILPIRAYASYNKDDPNGKVDLDVVAAGVRWAAANGAQIINLSISGTSDVPSLRAAVAEAQAAGALIVASSGNANTASDTNAKATRYPAAYDGVLGVVATDLNFAVLDDASYKGSWVDIAAPGMYANSAFYGGGDCIQGADAPSSSWATAYVSGAAALIAEQFPEAGPDYWAFRLMATADRPFSTARDNTVGWGFIRPYEALTAVDDGDLPGPLNPLFAPPPRVDQEHLAADIKNTSSPFRGTEQIGAQLVIGSTTVVLLLVLLAFRRRSRI